MPLMKTGLRAPLIFTPPLQAQDWQLLGENGFMSTFFFKATELKTDSTRLQQCMVAMQKEGKINSWKIEAAGGEPVLAVDTLQLSSEELKHQIREGGIDVEFAKAPQAG